MSYIPTDEEVAKANKLWAHPKLQRAIGKAIGANLREMLGKGLPFVVVTEELEQAGRMGAWIGCCRFDPSRGFKPMTYIGPYIHGYMRKQLSGLARERGCPRWRWDAGQYEEYELRLSEPQINEQALVLRDDEAAVALTDLLDGDWEVFRSRLPPFLRTALDGLLEGLSLDEAAMRGDATYYTASHYRSTIRRLWREFEAADREGRCVRCRRDGSADWAWQA